MKKKTKVKKDYFVKLIFIDMKLIFLSLKP